MSERHGCEFCNYTGFAAILDVWSIQEVHRDYGENAAKEKTARLPMIEGRVRCQECFGEAAFEEDMEKLQAEKGGNPWDAKTFEKTVN